MRENTWNDFKWNGLIMNSSLMYSIDMSLNCKLAEAEPALLAGVA